MKDRIVKCMTVVLCGLLVAGGMVVMREPHMEGSAAENAAKTLKIAKMTGTVQVTDSIGKKLPTFVEMNLKNGQHVKTEAASYAWINMDDSKTAKVDQQSDVDISQQNEDLEIRLNSGDVLINITKKVSKSATVKVRSGNSVTGITGTVVLAKSVDEDQTQYVWLEGSGTCSVVNSVSGEHMTVQAKAGDSVNVRTTQPTGDAPSLQVTKSGLTAEDITGGTAQELRDDPALAGRVQAANPGLDVQQIAQDADQIEALQAGVLQARQEDVDQGLNSDKNTVNNQVQQTKEEERKAAEEANKKHDDDDDDDESSQSGHTHVWGEHLIPGLIPTASNGTDIDGARNEAGESMSVFMIQVPCPDCQQMFDHQIEITGYEGRIYGDTRRFTWRCRTCGETGTSSF